MNPFYILIYQANLSSLQLSLDPENVDAHNVAMDCGRTAAVISVTYEGSCATISTSSCFSSLSDPSGRLEPHSRDNNEAPGRQSFLNW